MRPLSFAPVALLAGLACAGVGERTDTTKILPVEDINARDTTPTPPPPRVSRLTLLDSVPAGGICNVKKYRPSFEQAREITYETSTPPRTYIIEVGKGARLLPAVSLDIRGTQSSTGLIETENVYVAFSPAGKVSVGTRRYTATGTSTVNDREPLQMGDSAVVIAIARKILDLCDTGR